jgi:hypothetical protein
VKEDVFCIFNATPLEKYESYRLFLDQWSRCDDSPDYAPTIYNLIDSLANFLEINRYSPHNGTQPKFLVDMLPEVYGGSQAATLGRLLLRRGVSEDDLKRLLAKVEECGGSYIPQVNAFYVREFQMMHAAEDATRFLHQACQGLPHRVNGHVAAEYANSAEQRATDRFYARVLEHAIAEFGARVLYPSRPAASGENSPLKSAAIEKLAQAALRDEADLEATAREIGSRIGNQIYEAYLAGKVTPSGLKRLFLAHLDEPGMARKVCAAIISRLRGASRPSARATNP